MSKVLIGLSTMEHIRKADFLPHFLGLKKSEGAMICTVHGQSPAKSRNVIIEQALSIDATHILFIDDDMCYPPESLHQLLEHDVDVVTALYLMRSYPHFPVAFDEAYDDGRCKFMFLTHDPENGLIPIVNCGLGFVLIKTEVFRKLEKPWVTLGEIEKDGWCDDVAFFNKVRKAGFKMYMDPKVRCGHMVTMTLWPTHVDGKWYSEYKNEGGNVVFPQTVPDMSTVSVP